MAQNRNQPPNADRDQRQQQQQQNSTPRQQQQFDGGGARQPGGGAPDARFADQIREHMEVVDASGAHLGTVDHVQGDQIKLTRSDSSDGRHTYLPLGQVAGIENGKVRLSQ